jgi:hypothetical protein
VSVFLRFEFPLWKSVPALRFPPLAAVAEAVPAPGPFPFLAPRPPRGAPRAGSPPRPLACAPLLVVVGRPPIIAGHAPEIGIAGYRGNIASRSTGSSHR